MVLWDFLLLVLAQAPGLVSVVLRALVRGKAPGQAQGLAQGQGQGQGQGLALALGLGLAPVLLLVQGVIH